MEVKEAIEIINGMHRRIIGEWAHSDKEEEDIRKELDEIISLLQQGEKYRQIVEEIISSRYFSARDNEYLKSFKQKYFPKEIVKEVVGGITEQIKEGAEIARKEAENQ